MEKASKKRLWDVNDFKNIPLVPVRHLTLDELGVNFVDTVQKLKFETGLRSDYSAVILRPPPEYKPTVEEKLLKLMKTKINVAEYKISKVLSDYYDVYQNPGYNIQLDVQDFFSDGLEIKVTTEQQVAEAEVEFWNQLKQCSDCQFDSDYVANPWENGRFKNGSYGKVISYYGSDWDGSLYDHTSKYFNMLNFPNILQTVLHQYVDTISGITTPNLYFAGKNSLFPPHVEDNDQYSVNYSHRGNPKVWYVYERQYCPILQNAVGNHTCSYAKNICDDCTNILRHKRILFHPKIFQYHGCKLRKVIQYQNDIVLVPPRCIHYGFSTGESIGEAINFALEDSLSFGYTAKKCDKQELQHPTFSMEWFILKYQPQDYKDYINGHLVVVDPVDNNHVNAAPPVVTITHNEDSDGYTGLLASGISAIYMAKTQEGQEYVFANSPAGCSWLTRQFVETLRWTTKNGFIPVKLPDQLFSMAKGVITRMDEITDCLKREDEEGLRRIFTEAKVDCDTDYNADEDDGAGAVVVPNSDEGTGAVVVPKLDVGQQVYIVPEMDNVPQVIYRQVVEDVPVVDDVPKSNYCQQQGFELQLHFVQPCLFDEHEVSQEEEGHKTQQGQGQHERHEQQEGQVMQEKLEGQEEPFQALTNVQKNQFDSAVQAIEQKRQVQGTQNVSVDEGEELVAALPKKKAKVFTKTKAKVVTKTKAKVVRKKWNTQNVPPCSKCDKQASIFSTKQVYQRHIDNCLGLNKAKCPHCEYQARNDYIISHIIRKHKNVNM